MKAAQIESAPVPADDTGINTAAMPEQAQHATQAPLGVVTIDIII